MTDIVMCDICGDYTPFNKYGRDICPKCTWIERNKIGGNTDEIEHINKLLNRITDCELATELAKILRELHAIVYNPGNELDLTRREVYRLEREVYRLEKRSERYREALNHIKQNTSDFHLYSTIETVISINIIMWEVAREALEREDE